MRYVELNPVRAGIVAKPEDYQWSSYAHNALGKRDRLISEHPLYSGLGSSSELRQLAWRQICGQAITPEHIESLRKSIRAGVVISDPVYPEAS